MEGSQYDYSQNREFDHWQQHWSIVLSFDIRVPESFSAKLKAQFYRKVRQKLLYELPRLRQRFGEDDEHSPSEFRVAMRPAKVYLLHAPDSDNRMELDAAAAACLLLARSLFHGGFARTTEAVHESFRKYILRAFQMSDFVI